MGLFLLSVLSTLCLGQLASARDEMEASVKQLFEKEIDPSYVVTEIAIDCKVKEESGKEATFCFLDVFPQEAMVLAFADESQLGKRIEEELYQVLASHAVDEDVENLKECVAFTLELVKLSRDRKAFVKEIASDILERILMELEARGIASFKELTLSVTLDSGKDTKRLSQPLGRR